MNEPAIPHANVRSRPANRRAGETFEIVHAGQRYSVMLGRADASGRGEPLEVFVSAHQLSSQVEALARDAAILISFALQYGIPVAELRAAVTRGETEEPATIVGAILDAIGAERGRS